MAMVDKNGYVYPNSKEVNDKIQAEIGALNTLLENRITGVTG